MRELKRLNKFLIKYKGKLLLGLLITIISRVFSLVTPRLVGDSMTTIENYLSLNSISPDELKDVLFFNIVLIIGASLISGFFTFLMRQTIINVSRYIEYDVKKTYSAIGMDNASTLRMMERENLNAFKELLKSKNKSILRRVEKTYCDIGMCNYTTILMMYKEESKAANQSLEW